MVAFPANAQRFGGSIAATADDVFVGETVNVSFPGEVYVYSRSAEWAESARLRVSDEADRFGRAMGAHGETLLVGASHANGGKGVVHVYRKNDEDEWIHVEKLAIEDGTESDNFGTAIAFDGNLALISAPWGREGSGKVYVFRQDDGGVFSQIGTLVEEEVEENFGRVLAIQGNTIFVGVPGYNDNLGRVYIFEQSGDTFLRTGILESGAAAAGDAFGSALAVTEDMVFVGMPMVAQRQGAVVIFRRNDAGVFEEVTQLRAFEPQRAARFGASLAFDEGVLWVGAPSENRNIGAIYRFAINRGQWGAAQRQQSILVPDNGPNFGATMAVAGDVAVVGAIGVDRREGAAVILSRDDGWQEQAMVINDIKGPAAITGAEVQCSEGEAHGWPCDNIDLVAFLPIHSMGGVRGSMANDIWGWTDPGTGHEYALVGRSDGTAFVDVTIPERPVYVGNLPMTAGSRANVWRDIKVYKDHAYVVADGAGEHGMQVFDLSQLRAVENMPVTFEETALYRNIHSAHNIVINEATGFAFAVGASGGGETCGGGLHMIDIRDPAAPVFAGCFADTSTGRRKTGYSHDAQCVIYHGPDTQHQGREICIGSNETALSISDVTDKGSPVAISVAVYPKVAYAHQGWLSEDHMYFYMNDEGDEPQELVDGTRTLIWDVTDLDDPILVHEYIAETTTTDHNLYIKGNLMYQANYGSGLRILDITTPDDPVEIGFFDTTPNEGGGGGAWSTYPYFESGVIVVTSMGEGLFVLKRRPADI